MKELIKKEIEKSIEVKTYVLNNNAIIGQLELLVNKCLESLNSGGKIIFCGNGCTSCVNHLIGLILSLISYVLIKNSYVPIVNPQTSHLAPQNQPSASKKLNVV